MIEINNTIRGLCQQFLDDYKKQLQSDGKNASGELANTASYTIQMQGSMFTVYFILKDYWKYVENGRRAGRFPPPEAIEKWIQVKRLVPRSVDGKVPTTKQQAFLISREIARNGIPGTKSLQKTINKESSDVTQKICDELIRQLEEQVEKDINEVTK